MVDENKLIKIDLHLPQEDLIRVVCEACPEGIYALDYARQVVPRCKREIDLYEALYLYWFASQYNYPGSRILEIGTAWGYSASILAQACKLGRITTLNPKMAEFEPAKKRLGIFTNVQARMIKSTDYLDITKGDLWDLIFVDGDHAGVKGDLPYWNRLKVNGLMLFHDYAPADAKRRPCAPVYDAVNEFYGWLRGEEYPQELFDVSVIDEFGFGMVGFYKTKKYAEKIYGIP